MTIFFVTAFVEGMSEEHPDARLVDVSIEVPGTPEQVWQAIATGPGIACWFVPAEVEEREGGAMVTHHGPYGDAKEVVTGWDPPRRFAYEEREWAEGAPPWATEVLVEARAGGTCVVRLVSGVFSNGADWADDIDATESGWRQGLQNLRLYLTHFPGLACAGLFVVAQVPDAAAWAQARSALGLDGVAAGGRVSAPLVTGVVEDAQDDSVLVRTDAGLVVLSGWRSGDTTHLTIRGYFYGDDGPDVAARAEPAWRDWLGERFGVTV